MAFGAPRTLLGEVQALIVAVSLAIMALVAVIATVLISESLLNDLRHEAAATADDLASLLEYPLYNVDHETAVRIAETFLASEKIVGISLSSTAGGILLEKSLGAPSSRIRPISRTIEAKGMELGSFTITFSHEAVRASQRLGFLVALAVCLAVLVANVIVSRLVGRRVQRPFYEFFRTMETVAAGHYTTVIPLTRYADVNRLISHFNDMVGHIAAKSDEQRRTEHKLAAERQFLVDIIDFLPDATFIVDTGRRVVIWNRAAEELTGVTREEVIGKGDHIYAVPFFGERRPLLIDLLDQPDVSCEASYLYVHRQHQAIYAESFVPTLHQGRGAYLWGVAAPIYNRAGERIGAIEMIRDVSDIKSAETEKTRLREMLLQAQKMESVGRLAGGIAHDFNNMLTVILGMVQLTLMKLPPHDPMANRLRVVEETTLRSASLVGQLLAFARKQNIAPQTVDLDKAVEEMLPMLRRLIGEHIAIEWRGGAGGWSLWIDPSQLDQLLINLCVNARDAIGASGTIVIETCNVDVDASACRHIAESQPGEYVALTVSDNGCGMDEATIAQIYEPFFTTKEPGKGTGMGLATVYGVMRQNGGFIDVHSAPGRGTSFRLYFPRGGGEEGDAAAGAGGDGQQGQGERILLVEDDAGLLALAREILTTMGYEVTTTQSPGEAIALVGSGRERFDLLITDVVMPEMNGRELERRLRDLDPGLRSLFVSGYTADVIARHGVIDQDVCFLQKPFTLESLGRAVRRTLQGRGRDR